MFFAAKYQVIGNLYNILSHANMYDEDERQKTLAIEYFLIKETKNVKQNSHSYYITDILIAYINGSLMCFIFVVVTVVVDLLASIRF